MNEYKIYKIKKNIDKTIDKFFDFIFYIPRKIYKNNERFRNRIKESERNSYKKKRHKKVLGKILYDIESNEDKICVVAMFNDFDNDIICDRSGYDYYHLLEDDKWIKRNKLKVEKLKYKDFISKYHSEHSEKLKTYVWNKYVDEVVLIVSKIC